MHLVDMKRHLSNFNGNICWKPSCAEPEGKINKIHETKNKIFLDGHSSLVTETKHNSTKSFKPS